MGPTFPREEFTNEKETCKDSFTTRKTVIGYIALCLISPDGLLRAIYGPAPGATNDIKLTRDSRLIPELETLQSIR